MTVSTPSANVEILARTDAYVIAAWHRLLMLIWNAESNASGVEHSREIFDEWVKGHARGAVFLVVVQAKHARPPDDETRQAMRKTANSPSPGLRDMGTLIQAEGFVAASIRSIIMRLNVLTGHGAPNLFETASMAAEWAARVLSDSAITGAKLANAIAAAQGHRKA